MASCFMLAVFFVFIDQILKNFSLTSAARIDLLGTFFGFDFIKNYYIAFSLPLSGRWLAAMIVSIIIVIIAITCNLLKNREILALPLIFVIFGSISNLYDRLTYGYVIDYLDLKYFSVFNIADIMISAGLLIFLLLLTKEKNRPLPV